MSYLIFCSFEVGGVPFKMAETLNRFGVETYYIYLGKKESGHDSTQFHYGTHSTKWDLSYEFQDLVGCSRKVIKKLNQLKNRYQISHCLATGGDVYCLKQAGIDYLFWSYGGDLDYQCFIDVSLLNSLLKRKFKINPFRLFTEGIKARKSIRYAERVTIAPYQSVALKRICPDKGLFFLPHCLKVVDYQDLVRHKDINERSICREFQADRFFFSSTRHFWAGFQRTFTDNKGNDVMLRAYSKYLEITKDHRSKLILVSKGPDVESTKTFAKRLGIDGNIVWVNEMKREDLDRYYQGATICFGHFGTPVITHAILEALANGSVGVSFFDEQKSMVPFYNEYPPIFNNKDPKDISEFMMKVLSDRDTYGKLSYKSWLWIKNNCSEDNFVESFVKLFTEKFKN